MAKRKFEEESLEQSVTPNAKRATPASAEKNSISLLNELKIATVTYEVVSHLGPPHCPVITSKVLVRLPETELTFHGVANSKQKSKLHCAVQALHYLVKCSNTLAPHETAFYLDRIRNDFASLNIPYPDDTFNDELYTSFTSSTEVTVIETITKPAPQDVAPIKAEAANEAGKIEAKVTEMLNDNNLPSLLQYLIPNECFTLQTTQDQSTVSSGGLFHAQLRVGKNFPVNARNYAYKKETISPVDKLNPLIKETEHEYIFLGHGKSKMIARFNAIKTALTFLFNIKLKSEGKSYLNYLISSNSIIIGRFDPY